MPWNDNANPGPWGSPPSGGGDDDRRAPPGRPRNGGRRPDGPEISAAFDRLRERLRRLTGGPGGPRPGIFALIGGVVFALWALSGLYVVQPNEEAVVTTFGAYSRSEPPGLRYHLPVPIEHAEKVAVTALNRVDIGGTAQADVPQESLMLTRDENIVDLDFSVTWRVSDAPRFLFATRAPEEAVKAVAESVMREVVGRTDLQPIFGPGRSQVQLQVADLMQKTLDAWGVGVSIVEVQIRAVNPPAEVVSAFRDVQSAEQDRASAVNEARTEASRIIQSAQAYREQAVREAAGDAARFNQIYGEYRRAPQVTRERLYLETMQRVLAGSKKVVIDSKGATAPIILPPDAFRPRAAGEPQADPARRSRP